MKRLRIAISQRNDVIDGRNEVRDALDTRLAKLIWDLGFLPLPLTSGLDTPLDYLESLAPDGILLSGGNDIGCAPQRDAIEHATLDYASKHDLPVLGICRGMQFINHYLGGSMRAVTGHTAVKHQLHGPLVGNTLRVVNSYHDQGIYAEDLGDCLEAVAWTDDGVIEAFSHQERPWTGIMWHPERNTDQNSFDEKLIIGSYFDPEHPKK